MELSYEFLPQDLYQRAFILVIQYIVHTVAASASFRATTYY